MEESTDDLIGPWHPPAPAAKSRLSRLIPVIVPLVLVVVLVGGSGLVIARGVDARGETSRVDAETVRLAELEARAEDRFVAAERLARRIDQDLTVVVEATLEVSLAQVAATLAELDLVAAADGAVEQLNAGDISGGKAAFRSEVSAAADAYDAELAALGSTIETASDALASLDATLEARP